MVVGRKEGPCLDGIMEMLGDRPGNGEAVKGGGASANLIENDELVFGGVIDDERGFVHLDHEGGLSAG